VVNILDYATTPTGLPYIVMELLEGEDLEARIRGDRTLCLEDSSRVFVQICKALTKAHALGIVHRDIKPENVFLFDHEGDLFVKVLDFGIAKGETLSPSIIVETTLGTPSFMSPEQLFLPKEVDHRSDLWSAAVVVYRCLTGRLPFDSDNLVARGLAIRRGAFAAPSSHDSALPRALDAWFKKALSFDPAARFQSASEMAHAYLGVLEKAKLLPHWAVARESRGERISYTTDPGGISGGPIVLRRARRSHARSLVIAGLVATLGTVAASPKGSTLFRVFGALLAAPPSEGPRLNPPPHEVSPIFSAPRPEVPAHASLPALAKRDVAREVTPAPALPRRVAPRDSAELPARHPSSTGQPALPALVPENVEFGI
jgi:serine/threonine-protein kinase